MKRETIKAIVSNWIDGNKKDAYKLMYDHWQIGFFDLEEIEMEFDMLGYKDLYIKLLEYCVVVSVDGMPIKSLANNENN